MSYYALYRKYRLQTFDEMVGQDHISKTLKNAIINHKISHAYLFAGPRGTGKTSIAKLVAKAINCVGETFLCEKCEICQGISNNDISDIIEIDAASNNGVDEIREIRDKVKYAPSVCKYKVYIIDETHMLTTQAFNALLKTLEEPPQHVIFILATTEPHKIPLTILSRCQRFDFKKISESAIIERLQQVINLESITITNEAITLIAYLANGSMRDALSLLDQVSSYVSEEINVAHIYNITGTASISAVESLINALLQQSKKAILTIINDLNNEGKDLVKLCDSLIIYLRDSLAVMNGLNSDLIYDNSQVFKQVQTLTIDKTYSLIIYLNEVMLKLKAAHNPKVYLEVSLLNMLTMLQTKAITIPKEESVDLPVEEKVVEPVEPVKVKEPVVEVEEKNDKKPAVNATSRKAISNDELKKYLNYLRGVRINNTLVSPSKALLNELKSKWFSINDFEANVDNMHLISILQNCAIRASSSSSLIIATASELNVNKLMYELEDVEFIVQEVLANDYKVAFVSEDEWSRIKNDYVNKLKVGHTYSLLDEQTLHEYYEITTNEDEVVDFANNYFGKENIIMED